jgi:hypothetical protein
VHKSWRRDTAEGGWAGDWSARWAVGVLALQQADPDRSAAASLVINSWVLEGTTTCFQKLNLKGFSKLQQRGAVLGLPDRQLACCSLQQLCGLPCPPVLLRLVPCHLA